jgi:aryl-alcohol dehydrogenase-like predicted oxidoreductase
MEMRYNPLGRTGLFVSELCLGTMTFAGKGLYRAIGEVSEKEAERLIGTALDSGINFIDTANVYSDGDSERLVGAALKSLARPREQVVVATKVRGRVGPGVNEVGLSRAHIMSAIDASLRRLGLDHVDLYQIHGLDPATPIEETIRAFDDVVRAGKARAVGWSNLPAWVAAKALTWASDRGLTRFESAQVYYSIAGRDIEREVAPLCQAEGIAVLPWSPLAGGLLSGKFDPEKKGPSDSRRASFDFPPVNMERLPRVLAALREVAGAHGVSVARVALAWLLTRPFVTSVIIGAKRPEQLVDNIAAADLRPRLSAEQLAALDRASALPPEYPNWMIEFQNARDPRGTAGGPTEATVRAVADSLK